MSQTQSDRSKSPGQTKPRSGLRARDLENTTETEATAKKKKGYKTETARTQRTNLQLPERKGGGGQTGQSHASHWAGP